MKIRNSIVAFVGLILFMFMSSSAVDAMEFHPGHSGNASGGGLGVWHTAIDTSKSGKAYATFVANQYGRSFSYRYQGNPSIDDIFNRKTSTGETLRQVCQRSEFMWWYGAGTGNSEKTGHFYTLANSTNYPPVRIHGNMDTRTRRFFTMFSETNSSEWATGHVSIICSAAYVEEERNITISANSGTYTYTGSPHTVSGYKRTGDNLKSGHTATVDATLSRTSVGSYVVPVKSVVIRDSSGRNVSSEYNITTRQGILTINNKPDYSEGSRCDYRGSDSASAYTSNETVGSHGFTPVQAGTLNTLRDTFKTPAGKHQESSIPRVGNSRSSWNTWKNTFQQGSSTKTPELNLHAGNVSENLSKHGGVYNILRTLTKTKYDVEYCQPQERVKEAVRKERTVKVETKDDNGKVTGHENVKVVYYDYEWTPWKDVGSERLSKVDSPKTTKENNNYQILAVNCNAENFNKVRNATGGSVIRYGDGTGSSVLQTPAKSGTLPSNALGLQGITSTNEFYNDGTSCAEVFKCTVEPNVNLENEARNNKGNANLFGEVLEENKVGETNDKGELVFFRDNDEREVRADLWYPQATGKTELNSHFGAKAKGTSVRLYGKDMIGYVPTPEMELTTIAPWNNKDNGIKLQSNGNSSPITNYSNEVNRFNVKSQWASEEGKPYQFGINWKYNATANNRIPSKVDGYGVTANNDYSRGFDIYCDFRNGSSVYQANIPQSPYSNGTSNKPYWGTKTGTKINAIRALFTRSASAMD